MVVVDLIIDVTEDYINSVLSGDIEGIKNAGAAINSMLRAASAVGNNKVDEKHEYNDEYQLEEDIGTVTFLADRYLRNGADIARIASSKIGMIINLSQCKLMDASIMTTSDITNTFPLAVAGFIGNMHQIRGEGLPYSPEHKKRMQDLIDLLDDKIEAQLDTQRALLS